jgi:hypothetical protein
MRNSWFKLQTLIAAGQRSSGFILTDFGAKPTTETRGHGEPRNWREFQLWERSQSVIDSKWLMRTLAVDSLGRRETRIGIDTTKIESLAHPPQNRWSAQPQKQAGLRDALVPRFLGATWLLDASSKISRIALMTVSGSSN